LGFLQKNLHLGWQRFYKSRMEVLIGRKKKNQSG
jgi:hypothetical protein